MLGARYRLGAVVDRGSCGEQVVRSKVSVVIDLSALDLGFLQQASRHGDSWDPVGVLKDRSMPLPHHRRCCRICRITTPPSTAVRLYSVVEWQWMMSHLHMLCWLSISSMLESQGLFGVFSSCRFLFLVTRNALLKALGQARAWFLYSVESFGSCGSFVWE